MPAPNPPTPGSRRAFPVGRELLCVKHFHGNQWTVEFGFSFASSMRVLRFLLVAVFAACLLSVAANLCFPHMDSPPDEGVAGAERHTGTVSLSVVVGTSVWLLAFGIAWVDARQQSKGCGTPSKLT